MPGFLAGRRYRVHDGEGGHGYLAIYDIEADDLTVPFAELRARAAAGTVATSDLVENDPPPVIRFYEFIEEHHA
ncbi:hypothetical protein HFP15_16385 [Amycolatopsis sp. K13G38]|uniref:Uncharacterized protein n=1 Tax=Amycolatopsis acididurans TaxID=2724524 RepID=A0ABX1J7Y5_9PSEU|nr:hypothetical protein [Amycolatopsis acididurans]NKQ54460.1 hypothetical protein [Amycolatopsis acididurans]